MSGAPAHGPTDVTGARPALAAPGYVRFLTSRGAEVVALASAARAVREALAHGTMHEYGARQLAERAGAARRLDGRGPVYAVTLPDRQTRAVIRHSMHGGLLAPITRDLFFPPTRAPRELAAALRLAAAGVRTPEVIAYALYPVGTLLRRADVATREVPGRDLASVLESESTSAVERDAALAATAALLGALAGAGARHPDLNAKNILLGPADGAALAAWVLDVDVVRFRKPADARLAWSNAARLDRSLAKRGRHRPPGHAERDREGLRELLEAILPRGGVRPA